MIYPFDFSKEKEYIKNKESSLSDSATNIIKKILSIEECFKTNKISCLIDKTNFSFFIFEQNFSQHNTQKRISVSFKQDFEIFDLNQNNLENTYIKNLIDINSYLLSTKEDFFLHDVESFFNIKNEEHSEDFINKKIQEYIINCFFKNEGFLQEININNRFELYNNWLHNALSKELHQYIPKYIDALKSNTSYDLILDVFGYEVTFLTTNIKEVFFFEEDLSIFEDMHESFDIYKRIHHIDFLFNQIVEVYPSDSIFILDITTEFSRVILKNGNEENVIFKTPSGFKHHAQQLVINPKNAEESIINIICELFDNEELELEKIKQITKKIILQKEQKILKSNLTDESKINFKKRI